MKTILEYLINSHVNIHDVSSLFVEGDVVRDANFEDYIKVRDDRYRNVKYIKKEDLLNADFDDILKVLQKMFLEYSPTVFICGPMKHSNFDFVAFCSISIMTGEVDVYNHTDDVADIVKYFQRK